MIFAITLAIKEYVRGTGLFGLPGVQKSKGGHDLVSLTLLSAIVIGLVTFSLSAGRGVTENITQAMLGHVRGAGAPIWVFTNIGRGLDANALAVFANRGGYEPGEGVAPSEADPEVQQALGRLSFYPVVELEQLDPLVQLPAAGIGDAAVAGADTAAFAQASGAASSANGSDVWRKKVTENDVSVEFRAWAVDLKNPVYAVNAGDAAGPRTVVLSKKLFRERFNYENYRKVIAAQLPAPLLDDMPVSLDDLTELHGIYLALPFSIDEWRLLKFNVVWADSLPGIQKISMLIPFDMVMLAKAVRNKAALRFVLEEDVNDYDEPFQTLKRFTLVGVDRPKSQKLIGDGSALALLDSCLSARAREKTRKARASRQDSSNLLFEVPPSVSWVTAQACLSRAGLGDYHDVRPGFDSSPPVTARGRTIEAECESIRDPSGQSGPSNCDTGNAKMLYRPEAYFRAGLVFVPPGVDIADTIRNIKQYGDSKGKLFLIGETYQDALGRMDYTQKVIGYLTAAVAMLGFLLCASALYLQIRPLVAARLPTYGLLLARGIHAYSIYAAVAVQMLIAVMIASIFATVLVSAIYVAFEWMFGQSTAAHVARVEFGLSEPRLIPLPVDAAGHELSWLTSVAPSLSIGVAVTALLTLVFALTSLLGIPLRRTTTPVELIVGRRDKPDRSRP
ncbi:MAG: hypothetical protein KDK89_15120 [Alphaproteobacteria bacterium]|nr:hypothetical protein [Alphaproteobacteria bacterium]